jgi:hypothetical protein
MDVSCWIKASLLCFEFIYQRLLVDIDDDWRRNSDIIDDFVSRNTDAPVFSTDVHVDDSSAEARNQSDEVPEQVPEQVPDQVPNQDDVNHVTTEERERLDRFTRFARSQEQVLDGVNTTINDDAVVIINGVVFMRGIATDIDPSEVNLERVNVVANVRRLRMTFDDAKTVVNKFALIGCAHDITIFIKLNKYLYDFGYIPRV